MANLKERMNKHKVAIQESRKKIREKIPEGIKKKVPHKFAKDFREFLREYKIVGLAIAFVVGAAANQLVKSLVDNIVMPLINPLIPSGTWQQAVLRLGPFLLSWGKFLSDFIYFAIVALVIFIIVKKLLQSEKK